MPVALEENARNLLDGKNFAVLATLLSDGAPQTSVVWVKRDQDAVLISKTSRRQKAHNARDGRVRLTVFDLENPYRFVELRGNAEVLPDPD